MDYTCAPMLSRTVDTATLPYERLRSLVVEAFRAHKDFLLRKDLYIPHHSVRLIDPYEDGGRMFCVADDDQNPVRLSQDGRFLLVLWGSKDPSLWNNRIQVLHVYDLVKGGAFLCGLSFNKPVFSFEMGPSSEGTTMFVIELSSGTDRSRCGIFNRIKLSLTRNGIGFFGYSK